ncbi:hypothetical protein GPALN_002974, partial [Globodera pallida]
VAFCNSGIEVSMLATVLDLAYGCHDLSAYIGSEGGKWDAPVAQLEELPTDWVQDHRMVAQPSPAKRSMIRENSAGWDETVKTLRRGQKITHKEGGKWDAPVAQLEELPTDWVQDVAAAATEAKVRMPSGAARTSKAVDGEQRIK